MKNRHIELSLADGVENRITEISEKLSHVNKELDEMSNENLCNTETFFILIEEKHAHEIELSRLQLATYERVQHEIKTIKSQCRMAESKYQQFDADDQNLTEKISLLINWGKLIVTARTCGIERVGETDRFRKEALALHKQIAPKRGTSSSNASAEVWTSFLAETFKIFAKLKIDEKHTVMFLQHSLVDSFSLM